MNALEGLIHQEISAAGPISVARYMELCLTPPKHGYYTTRDPLGAARDFTTAPEISQMFGEMIGVWVVAAWQAMNSGQDFKLVELGPGRGTLMADAMRVLRTAGVEPEIWFVEASPELRLKQAERLPNAHWVERLEEVPHGPTVFIANEFFDALPVRQFLRAEDGWRERLVGYDDDRLIWGLGPAREDKSGIVGEWREFSQSASDILGQIALRLTECPSAALIVDYGYTALDRPVGPTLQAVREHSYADPLQAPGSSDLTWLLDFDGLEALFSAKHCPMGTTSQGHFLTRLGIGHRAEALAKAQPAQANVIADALDRLTAPDQMGSLFKVLGAVSPGMTLPPGLDAGL